MAKVTVYGASDDLIEIEGDIREEFSAYEDKAFLAFSDGTLLSIEYSDLGVWHIRRLATGSAACELRAADGADSDNYSDRVTLTGDIRWVVAGPCYATVEA